MDAHRRAQLREWAQTVGPLVVSTTGLVRELVSVVVVEYVVSVDHVWKPVAQRIFEHTESHYTLADVGSRRWRIQVPTKGVWWAGFRDDDVLLFDISGKVVSHKDGMTIVDLPDNIEWVEFEPAEEQVLLTVHTLTATKTFQFAVDHCHPSRIRPWIQLGRSSTNSATILTIR